MPTHPTPIFDVFQTGLRRGSEYLPHDPAKAYAYVEHPTEGWRVYLRSAVFLHSLSDFRRGHFDPKRFIVVKKAGVRYSAATWEPPKGQMEGKDIRTNQSVLQLLTNNVLRETEEESHITEIEKLRYTGMVFQSQETTYPHNWYFQYHIFQGFVTDEQIKKAFAMFEWIHEHPKAFARFRRDRREKDDIAWFDPHKTHLNPRWCPAIFVAYLQSLRHS